MDNEDRLIKNNKFLQLWLIIGIITGFAGVLFFSITYLNEKVLCNMNCRIQNEVSIVLVLLSLFGMFIGSLTYYFISEKYEKKITNIQKNANLSLKFLDGESEKLIVNSKELDSLVFRGELSKEECEQKRNEIEKQLIKLDLEISFKKIVKRIDNILEKQNPKKLNNLRKLELNELILTKKNCIKEIGQANNLYSKNKFPFDSLILTLKEKHSEIMEIEEDLKELFRKQVQANTKQTEILLATTKELEKEKANEIVEDLYDTLNPQKKAVLIELSKKQKIEINHHKLEIKNPEVESTNLRRQKHRHKRELI